MKKAARSSAPNPEAILQSARRIPAPKEDLEPYRPTIESLREKGYGWREVAEFLKAEGLAGINHIRVYRYMKGGQFEVPGARDYATALEALRGADAVTTEVMAMLRHHWAANNRTVTFSQLAQAVHDLRRRRGPAPSAEMAQLAYSAFGHSLGVRLRMPFSKTYGGNFAHSAIGFENPYRSKGTPAQLVMHHELAKALETTGWVESLRLTTDRPAPNRRRRETSTA